MADYLNIAGRIRTTASDGVAMEAQEVKDLNQNKSQQEINADVQTELGDRYTKEETYNREELNELITTPDVNYVSVVATSATTSVTDVLPAEGAADTIYRVGNWDGTQYDPTMYALYAWNGSAYVCVAVRSFVGEVYDVSVNHPDGQGNPTPYTDLAAALGTGGANIPADIRRGGMRIQFIQGTVQSSDNKYVRADLMANTFTTDVGQWQVVSFDGSDFNNPDATKRAKIPTIGAIVDGVEYLPTERKIMAVKRDVLGGYILQAETVTKGSTLFTNIDVNTGDIVDFSFTLLGPTGKIRLYDTNNQQIGYDIPAGDQAQGDTATGSFSIPSNFGRAILTNWNNVSNMVLKLNDESVVMKRIEFLDKRNGNEYLFTLTDTYFSVTEGKYLDYEGYMATEPIAISRDRDLVLKGFEGTGGDIIAFLDKNFNLISGTSRLTNTIINRDDIPTGTKYVILSKPDSAQPTVILSTIEGLSMNLTRVANIANKDSFLINNRIKGKVLVDESEVTKGSTLFTYNDVVEGDNIHYTFTLLGETGKLRLLDKDGNAIGYDIPAGSQYQGQIVKGSFIIPSGFHHAILTNWNDVSNMKIVASGIYNDIKSDVVKVGNVADNYEYTDVNTAAQTGKPVEVSYGTFKTNVTGLTTNKTIIGKDKTLSILFDDSGDRTTPPVEMSGGLLKNLTLKEDGTGTSAAQKAYCVHSDNANCENNKLVFENCKFEITNSTHAVGLGVYGGEEVVFENCEIIQNTGNRACVFIHNSGNDATKVAMVKFHNCYFSSVDACLKLKQYAIDCKIKFEFINCTVVSETYGVTDNCVNLVTGDQEIPDTSFTGQFELLPTSHGNNVQILNYSA